MAQAEPCAAKDLQIRVGFAAFSASSLLRAWNSAFCELLLLARNPMRRGLRLSALLRHMTELDAYRHREGQAFIDEQRAAMRSEACRSHLRQHDGRMVEVASEPLPDGSWLILATDVTSSGLRPAEPPGVPLDNLIAFIPHGICIYGPDRRLVTMNAAYAEIMKNAPIALGETVEEIIRRRALAGEFGPGDPDRIVEQELSRDLRRDQVRRRVRPDGSVIDVRTAPLPDGGHVSVVTDISQLSRAEKEAGRRAAEMDTMLASIRHGIVLIGADRRVIACNRVATDLLGRPPALLQSGSHFSDVLEQLLLSGAFGHHPDPSAFVRERLALDRRLSYLSHIKTNRDRHLEIRSDPTPDLGFVLTITDVTEEMAARAELRHAKLAAEAANQAKSRFLATMSHELRTPLNAVIGFSDALIRDVGSLTDPVQIGEFAQEINEAGRHLLSLVNNILDVARIDAGRFDLAADRIDLGRLLGIVARQFGQAARAAELVLTATVAPDLPEVRADERRLQQVLAHLLSNAVKFTGAGGSVILTADALHNGNLNIRVADTGIGIADADLGRVFEPFTQLDGNLDRRFQGAGLGLYVSKALVEAQGGRLTLTSKLGVGTVAEITLPIRALPDASQGRRRQEIS